VFGSSIEQEYAFLHHDVSEFLVFGGSDDVALVLRMEYWDAAKWKGC